MGLTPDHAMAPTLRPLPHDMALELFGDIVQNREAAFQLAASPRCLAIGLAFRPCRKQPPQPQPQPQTANGATPSAAGAVNASSWTCDDVGAGQELFPKGSSLMKELTEPIPLPIYEPWHEPHEPEPALPSHPPLVLQVLYSQYPYAHPDPVLRLVWPWGAEGEGWRTMSAAFRSWVAVRAASVFRATGCEELHLWFDACPPWKLVIPARPDEPTRVEA